MVVGGSLLGVEQEQGCEIQWADAGHVGLAGGSETASLLEEKVTRDDL